MATIYSSPQLVTRRVKRPKERPDVLGFLGDIIAAGAGYYGGRHIADTQSKTAIDVANINAAAQKAMIEAQTDQLMQLFNAGEADRAAVRDLALAQAGQVRSSHSNTMEILGAEAKNAMDVARFSLEGGRTLAADEHSRAKERFGWENPVELRNKQLDVMGQQIESMKIGNQTNTALLADLVEGRKTARSEMGLQRRLDALESEKYEAGAGAALAQQERLEASVADPLEFKAMIDRVERTLPSGWQVGSSRGRQNLNETVSKLTQIIEGDSDPLRQQAALQALEQLTPLIDQEVGAVSLSSLIPGGSALFGGAELQGVRRNIDEILGSPTATRVRRGAVRAGVSPEVARIRAEVPFAARKRAAQEAYFPVPAAPPANVSPTTRLITGPPMGIPTQSVEPVFGPPSSPTTMEVHTPLGPISDAGPMGDIGRMMAMRRLEEMGLVA